MKGINRTKQIKKHIYQRKKDLSKKLKNTEQEIVIITDKIKENTSSGHNLNVDKLRFGNLRKEAEKIYIIRGQKVMLDFELAEI